MNIEIRTLDDLAKLDGKLFGLHFERDFERIIDDLRDRPTLEKPRTISIVVVIR